MHRLDGVTRRELLRGSAATAGALALFGPKVNLAWAKETDRIRVGLVGCGTHGSRALRDCLKSAPGVELTALADVSEARLAAARTALGTGLRAEHCFAGLQAYGELMALEDVDLVLLATPPAFRPEQFKEAVERGKHVALEAPVAICPAGVDLVVESARKAAEKGLAVGAGTQRRHHAVVVETMKRIADGALGNILAAQCYLNQGATPMTDKRQPGEGDVQWQLRNWRNFTWLSGDFIVEQHVHNIDVLNWATGAGPQLVHAMGGRQRHTGPEYGDVYDHFGTEFFYPNEVHVISTCRRIEGADERVGERVVGTKGSSNCRGTIDGETPWQYDGPEPNAAVQQHADLVNSIRSGTPLNEGEQAAESTLAAVMARESAYSRQRFKASWFAKKCTLSLLPPTGLQLNDTRPAPAAPVPGTYQLPGLAKAEKKK